MIIEEEEFTEELAWEAMPMTTDNYEEVRQPNDPDYDLNIPLYSHMAQLGNLLVVTARVDGELVGYTMFVVAHDPHSQDDLQANQDVLFVRQGSRKTMLGAGLGLIDKAEELLKARGVKVVYQHVKVYKDYSPMLERLGYDFVEKIYKKRLD